MKAATGTGDLGFISAQGESGSMGTSAIGYDEKGGTSYGKYQIASKTGTMDKFLDHLESVDPKAASMLRGSGPADTGSNIIRDRDVYETARSRPKSLCWASLRNGKREDR